MDRILTCSLVCLCIGGGAWGQTDDPSTAIRTEIESQFEQFDEDGDGKLSDEELEAVPQETRTGLRKYGLRKQAPVSRDEFVTAGVAQQMAKEVDGDRSLQKELKNEEGPSPTAAESLAGSPTGPRRTLKGKNRFTPRLPAAYLVHDKNGDGQIGLYEWDRAKYAEFTKLDKNGDGFLTAAELTAKSSPVAAGAKPDAKGEPVEQDPIGKEARDTFVRMDSNRDGGIAEDEWAKSQRVRPMFENAGINASLPMDHDTFVTHYRKAKANEMPSSGDGRR